MKLIPVIMSGGSGSRLWPHSRSLYPKQFLPLVGDHTMLQSTVARLDGIQGICKPVILANVEHRFLVAEQLRQMGKSAEAIILEPVARNTAPAVALAAIKTVSKENGSEAGDPILLMLAADHFIQDVNAFHRAIVTALPAAQNGQLVTFGVIPTKPETGYGYIKVDKSSSNVAVMNVMQFVEKPDLITAEEYIASGDYYWNSGMFMFRASRYLEELNRFRPDIFSVCEKAMAIQHTDLDFVRLCEETFKTCPEESIDYAVMEKTADSVVVPLDAGWSDLGSWSSLADISSKDSQGNSTVGDALLYDTRNTYVRSEKKLIATVGVDDLVIAESDDAILVAKKDKVQDVKKVVAKLKEKNRPEVKLHRKVYRPWGSYDSIDVGERFQVKRITVKPGAQLSLQKHYHRAEHWVVVKGTAQVTNGDQEIILIENQSTYIPIGVVHRLQNPGKFDLELIEVQSGGYLGEDDIVRLDDTYGRS